MFVKGETMKFIFNILGRQYQFSLYFCHLHDIHLNILNIRSCLNKFHLYKMRCICTVPTVFHLLSHKIVYFFQINGTYVNTIKKQFLTIYI